MEWEHPQLAAKIKFKNETNSENMMLIAFGILKGQYWNMIKRGA